MLITALTQQCAPMVAPSTLAAIVQVESGGNPLAMWNNTTGQRVIPDTPQQAVDYLQQALARGDKVDVGIAQVDTENFSAYGLTPITAFDACRNLRVGGEILKASYQKAVSQGLGGQVALYHAFEAYNSGHLWGDSVYANRVLRAAGIPVALTQGREMFMDIPQWKSPFAQNWKPRRDWLQVSATAQK
jgi:type IV secretion system protein VirB1